MSEVKTLTHEQVMEIIPHRDPMLLIDEATEFVPGERKSPAESRNLRRYARYALPFRVVREQSSR